MYPQAELSRLTAEREALSLRIARNRLRCSAAMKRVAEPLAWVDQMLVLWRKYATPLVLTALPLGFVLKRVIRPKPRLLGLLLRWGPLVFGVARNIMNSSRRTKPI